MPGSLVKLLSWITDEKAFKACSIPSDVKKESVRKCLALTECVVANSRAILNRKNASRNVSITTDSIDFMVCNTG
jgi:hypothetical protein